jgi:hypothetical protein
MVCGDGLMEMGIDAVAPLKLPSPVYVIPTVWGLAAQPDHPDAEVEPPVNVVVFHSPPS